LRLLAGSLGDLLQPLDRLFKCAENLGVEFGGLFEVFDHDSDVSRSIGENWFLVLGDGGHGAENKESGSQGEDEETFGH